ncbi:unnamed protein product [Periconia digitata]|uniref:Uncharacterized protein n=1 Tax=Periconia digitata TaxID=1303443 RepID=A0A9W4UJF4_9PLEO|nr:unnamed protein product [Periconia digitata]
MDAGNMRIIVNVVKISLPISNGVLFLCVFTQRLRYRSVQHNTWSSPGCYAV